MTKAVNKAPARPAAARSFRKAVYAPEAAGGDWQELAIDIRPDPRGDGGQVVSLLNRSLADKGVDPRDHVGYAVLPADADADAYVADWCAAYSAGSDQAATRDKHGVLACGVYGSSPDPQPNPFAG